LPFGTPDAFEQLTRERPVQQAWRRYRAPMPPSAVGQRGAALGLARRLTQRDLANAAGVSLSMLRKIEQGSRTPSEDVVDALAKALGTGHARLTGVTAMTDSRAHGAIPQLRQVIDAWGSFHRSFW
jgi:ribosome-binding protein aMBF1 (putative translation factor)